MMLAWSFAARTVDEVARLVRALGKHRYVREVDHRLHWSVDAALADVPAFAPHARAFEAKRRAEPSLDPASRDPSLWRAATADDVALALAAFWTPGAEALAYRARLAAALASVDLPAPDHAPFACSPDDPPHPELVWLDWVLLPVDDLDPERHAGALAAMGDSGDEAIPGAPVFQEGPILSIVELCDGCPNGVLLDDFLVWSDEPYSYADYVLRGASKAAKLVDPPVGYRDL
jgi:hypothetical protein